MTTPAWWPCVSADPAQHGPGVRGEESGRPGPHAWSRPQLLDLVPEQLWSRSSTCAAGPCPPVQAGSGQTSSAASAPAPQGGPEPVGSPGEGRGHLEHLGRARHMRVRAGRREPLGLLELGTQVTEFLLAEGQLYEI